MVSGVWFGVAMQLSSHGHLRLHQLDISAPPGSAPPGREVQPRKRINFQPWAPALDLPRSATHRLFVDQWFCRGITVAPDSLGEHRRYLLPMPVLPSEVPDRVSVATLSAPLSSASDPGSLAVSAKDSNQPGPGNRSGGCGNRVDDLDVERKRHVVSELGAHLASLVFGRDRTKTWQRDPMHLSTAEEESAA